MSSTLAAARKQWRDQVKALAHDRFYKTPAQAERFFCRNIEPVWREALPELDDDVDLVKALSITPTMLQLLHFFAHAYEANRLQLRFKSSKPTIRVWPPHAYHGAIRFFHAVPKKDLAKIVGRSEATIVKAFARFRGKRTDRAGTIKALALVQPIAVPTGLMLDIKLTPQMSFGFMFEDYQVGKSFAEVQAIGQCETWDMQRDHCAKALGDKLRIRQSDQMPALLTGTDG